MANPAKLAIIGMGPRGLGAAEALLACGADVKVDLFDPVRPYGAGPNFDPDESPLCLLNLPVREVSIDNGAFGDWLDAHPEAFPPRAHLGRFFVKRFEAWSARMAPTVHAQPVKSLERRNDGWWLLADREHGPFQEVLLTQGQPRTAPDPQLAGWQEHAELHKLPLCHAYPGIALQNSARAWAGRVVGVRGLGLSTHDVLRVLTLGQGGRFEGEHYIRSEREPARIVPFSLDGHAPAPKPAGADIDARFEPLEAETSAFRAALNEAVHMAAEEALDRVCAVLEMPVTRLAGVQPRDVTRWLALERETPGSQENREAIQALVAHVAMARGGAPDLGYALGQLWRKWQDPLRQVFNPARMAPETAAALLKFDEGLKRFSYGPPLRSSEELLALTRAGVVDLRAVDDPDIRLVPDGWVLDGDAATLKAEAMVDAVLPSPALDSVTDPLVESLVRAGWLHPLAGGLGAATADDGLALTRDGLPAPGLAILGRMASGSVIAVDSIHDCFGAAANRWAQGVATRTKG